MMLSSGCGGHGCAGTGPRPGRQVPDPAARLRWTHDRLSESNATVPVAAGGKTEEYYVVQSPSYTNWVILRGFLVDGKPDAAVKMFEEGVKIYPLEDAQNPPAMEFINLSRAVMNTIHANDENSMRNSSMSSRKSP